MENNKLIIYAALFLAVLATACSKEERVMYQQDPRVYFTKFVTNSDSTMYTFATGPDDITVDTAWLNFRIMGDAVDHDREIKLTVLDTSTAVAGYHYAVQPLIIPANAFDARIPVLLYRRPGLKDSMVHVVFEISESADFKPGYSDKPNPFANKYDRLHYKVSINDQLLKPGNWDGSLSPSFGAYSMVKFKFMIDVTGKTVWTGAIFPGDMQYLIQSVKLALYNYEQANGPMYDENGEQVVFP
ncbi:DUF4843 domain-containing protein [Chitinophaga cymbidii]|nr:DUF4843 domain-containing protein [Chitinophaga cymbidii]